MRLRKTRSNMEWETKDGDDPSTVSTFSPSSSHSPSAAASGMGVIKGMSKLVALAHRAKQTVRVRQMERSPRQGRRRRRYGTYLSAVPCAANSCPQQYLAQLETLCAGLSRLVASAQISQKIVQL